MKKFFILIAVVFAFLTSCEKKVVEMSEFPVDLLNEMKDVQSISYDVEYKMRYLGEPDTTIRHGNCTLIKVPSDTLFGGLIWLDVNDTLSLYYDLNDIYELNHNSKTITRYDAHNGEDWAISGSSINELIDLDFLVNYEMLTAILQNTEIKKTYYDTVMYNDKYLILNLKYNDTEEVKNISFKYLINTTNKYLSMKTSNMQIFDVIEYKNKRISNIRLNSFTPKMMDLEFRKYKDFTVTYYEQPESKPLLDTNTIAPDFSGYYYPDSTEFKLSDFRGKIVLLDFFYMSCYYCIQAVPHLSELFYKYKDKDVVVLGINPFDNNENSLRRLPKFIENNNMTYQIIFVDQEISKLFNVSGYPTMYLIDKEGTIKYRSAGWGEGVKDIYESELLKLME